MHTIARLIAEAGRMLRRALGRRTRIRNFSDPDFPLTKPRHWWWP